jgi:2-methylcitrate dehydratase PrpD
VVVSGEKISSAGTAYVNAQLANVLDADETLLNFTHFASIIVMPALAVAEMVGASGADLVKAVAIGFDVAARAGLSLPNSAVSSDGVITHARSRGVSWAALGTAAAVSSVLGATSDVVANAFGTVLATVPMHGTLERFMESKTFWHKYAMYGAIAEAGLNAAFLAEKGFKADESIFDPGSGWPRAFGAEEWNTEALLAGLGSRWFIEETSFKPYPFGRFGIGAVDAFAEIIAATGAGVEDIERVVLTIPPHSVYEQMVRTTAPTSDVGIFASLPFALSLIAARIAPGPRWWNAEHRTNSTLGQLASKVEYVVNKEWGPLMAKEIADEGFYRTIPVTVEVRLRDGTTSVVHVDHVKGDPWAPGFEMTDEELDTKVHTFTVDQIGLEGADHLLQAGRALSHAPSVDELVSSMIGPGS